MSDFWWGAITANIGWIIGTILCQVLDKYVFC